MQNHKIGLSDSRGSTYKPTVYTAMLQEPHIASYGLHSGHVCMRNCAHILRLRNRCTSVIQRMLTYGLCAVIRVYTQIFFARDMVRVVSKGNKFRGFVSIRENSEN